MAARNGATDLASVLGQMHEAIEKQKAQVLNAEVRKRLYLTSLPNS